MIDLHVHLLPGLDDGAQSLEEAVLMARIAAADGIRDMIATPHVRSGVYENRPEAIHTAVHLLQRELEAACVPVRVHPGAEVMVGPETLERFLAGELVTLGDAGRFLLMELPMRSLPSGMEWLWHELQVVGVTPVLAHPERHEVLREQLDLVERWVEQGVMTQVTAGSLLGVFGKRSCLCANELIERGLVHVIASDAHDARRHHQARKPLLRAAYSKLEEHVPVETVEVFRNNAAAVLGNDPTAVVRPQAMHRKRSFLWFG